MKRLLASSLLTCTLFASPLNPAIPLFNQFAATYTEWAHLYSHHNPAIYNAREHILWVQLKEQWLTARRAADAQYKLEDQQ